VIAAPSEPTNKAAVLTNLICILLVPGLMKQPNE
jgi:hypothetical protein